MASHLSVTGPRREWPPSKNAQKELRIPCLDGVRQRNYDKEESLRSQPGSVATARSLWPFPIRDRAGLVLLTLFELGAEHAWHLRKPLVARRSRHQLRMAFL